LYYVIVTPDPVHGERRDEKSCPASDLVEHLLSGSSLSVHEREILDLSSGVLGCELVYDPQKEEGGEIASADRYAIHCCLELPDKRLIAGCTDGELRIYNLSGVSESEEEREREEPIKPVSITAHESNGGSGVRCMWLCDPWLITGGDDGQLCVWDAGSVSSTGGRLVPSCTIVVPGGDGIQGIYSLCYDVTVGLVVGYYGGGMAIHPLDTFQGSVAHESDQAL